MSYPFDKTYLEEMNERKEGNDIRKAYYVLIAKYEHDNNCEVEDLPLHKQLEMLGEAIEIESSVVGNRTDDYHFMWDVLDALFGSEYEEEKASLDTDHENTFIKKIIVLIVSILIAIFLGVMLYLAIMTALWR